MMVIFITRRNYFLYPQEGDTIQEFTTRENYPLPHKKYIKNLEKIIIALFLMHPCLFSK